MQRGYIYYKWVAEWCQHLFKVRFEACLIGGRFITTYGHWYQVMQSKCSKIPELQVKDLLCEVYNTSKTNFEPSGLRINAANLGF